MIQNTKDFIRIAQNNALKIGVYKEMKKDSRELDVEKFYTLPEDKINIQNYAGNEEIQEFIGKYPVNGRKIKNAGISPKQEEELSRLKRGEYLKELVTEEKISLEELEKILAIDKNRRIEENMIKEHEQSEKDAMKDSYINMWLESQKAEKERIKAFMAFLDAMRQIDGEITAGMVATNKSIQEIWYKALFGDDK